MRRTGATGRCGIAALAALLLALPLAALSAGQSPGQTDTKGAVAAPAADTGPAVYAAERWLWALDDGRYADSWSAAAGVFRTNVTQDKWVAALQAMRNPVGTLVLRRLKNAEYSTHLEGAPTGEYVTAFFSTRFEKAPAVQEALALAKEVDGQWRVAGYAMDEVPAPAPQAPAPK